MSGRTRNPVGWGYVEEGLSEAERRRAITALAGFFGDDLAYRPAPVAAGVPLRPGRVTIPPALRACLTDSHEERLLHALGRGFQDLARLREQLPLPAPDVVAYPDSEQRLRDVLAWAADKDLAVIPFGGGSSVVGGVTPQDLEHWPGCVSVDLQRLSGLVAVDERSRVAEVRAGTLGPDLDAALKPHGLSLRYFPQSYRHSTVGGWLATRGAGHFSTLHAKIEDQVQSMRVMLADGSVAETLPVPASSIGPDPNRLWCGSEGALGIITGARLRVHPLPRHRATRGVDFTDFDSALEAAREIVQQALWPEQLRLLDPTERLLSNALSGAGGGEGALLIVGFESAHQPVEQRLGQALRLAAAHGGRVAEAGDEPGRAVGSWRDTFFRQPYLRDLALDYGMVVDTFETAVPWSRLPGFYHDVRHVTEQALRQVCGGGIVACRTTHAYSDGISLYFSFYGRGEHGALLRQWQAIKAAVSEAVVAGGGTISHHHAMGRDHRQWARREIPAAFREAIRGAKQRLDPAGRLNPGLWFED